MLDLIGKPWECPCDPPRSFDCWELVRYVRAAAGIDTPEHVPGPQRTEKLASIIRKPPAGWTQLDAPTENCVARIGWTRNHVGVYRRGRILHVMRATGVRADREMDLRALMGPVTYWEYRP